MKINFAKTGENLQLINVARLARLENMNQTMVGQVAKGIYPFMGSPKAIAVIEMLRRRGYLVEEPDEEQAA
jgi:hypothetical protein